MDIFISYSSKDLNTIKELAGDLTQMRHNVWLDQSLTGGQQWWDTILEQIRTRELFIFVLSNASLNSDPCRLEYEYAHDLDMRILPLVIEDINLTDLPEALATIQYVTYTPEGKQSALQLTAALNNLPPAMPRPDPLPTPPDVPVSPLNAITEQLKANQLTSQQQYEILIELKLHRENPDIAAEVNRLLGNMRKRPDVLAMVKDEIDGLIAPSAQKANENRARSEKTSLAPDNSHIYQKIKSAIQDIHRGNVRQWRIGALHIWRTDALNPPTIVLQAASPSYGVTPFDNSNHDLTDHFFDKAERSKVSDFEQVFLGNGAQDLRVEMSRRGWFVRRDVIGIEYKTRYVILPLRNNLLYNRIAKEIIWLHYELGILLNDNQFSVVRYKG